MVGVVVVVMVVVVAVAVAVVVVCSRSTEPMIKHLQLFTIV